MSMSSDPNDDVPGPEGGGETSKVKEVNNEPVHRPPLLEQQNYDIGFVSPSKQTYAKGQADDSSISDGEIVSDISEGEIVEDDYESRRKKYTRQNIKVNQTLSQVIVESIGSDAEVKQSTADVVYKGIENDKKNDFDKASIHIALNNSDKEACDEVISKESSIVITNEDSTMESEHRILTITDGEDVDEFTRSDHDYDRNLDVTSPVKMTYSADESSELPVVKRLRLASENDPGNLDNNSVHGSFEISESGNGSPPKKSTIKEEHQIKSAEMTSPKESKKVSHKKNVKKSSEVKNPRKRDRLDQQGHFKCTICEKTFGWTFSLKEHMKTHGEKKEKCPKCGKLFARACVRNVHLKNHCKENKISSQQQQKPQKQNQQQKKQQQQQLPSRNVIFERPSTSSTISNPVQISNTQIGSNVQSELSSAGKEWYDFFKRVKIDDKDAKRYALRFQIDMIRMAQLNLLTEDRLIELGITAMGDRLSIIHSDQVKEIEIITIEEEDPITINSYNRNVPTLSCKMRQVVNKAVVKKPKADDPVGKGTEKSDALSLIDIMTELLPNDSDVEMEKTTTQIEKSKTGVGKGVKDKKQPQKPARLTIDEVAKMRKEMKGKENHKEKSSTSSSGSYSSATEEPIVLPSVNVQEPENKDALIGDIARLMKQYEEKKQRQKSPSTISEDSSHKEPIDLSPEKSDVESEIDTHKMSPIPPIDEPTTPTDQNEPSIDISIECLKYACTPKRKSSRIQEKKESENVISPENIPMDISPSINQTPVFKRRSSRVAKTRDPAPTPDSPQNQAEPPQNTRLKLRKNMSKDDFEEMVKEIATSKRKFGGPERDFIYQIAQSMKRTPIEREISRLESDPHSLSYFLIKILSGKNRMDFSVEEAVEILYSLLNLVIVDKDLDVPLTEDEKAIWNSLLYKDTSNQMSSQHTAWANMIFRKDGVFNRKKKKFLGPISIRMYNYATVSTRTSTKLTGINARKANFLIRGMLICYFKNFENKEYPWDPEDNFYKAWKGYYNWTEEKLKLPKDLADLIPGAEIDEKWDETVEFLKNHRQNIYQYQFDINHPNNKTERGNLNAYQTDAEKLEPKLDIDLAQDTDPNADPGLMDQRETNQEVDELDDNDDE